MSATAAVDQGEGGHRVRMVPSDSISAGPTHVGQPLLEAGDPDQHNRACNQPASTTSVTCKRFSSDQQHVSLYLLNE